MSSARSSSEKSPTDINRSQQEIRHLSRHRSTSSSVASDRPIYLAQKEETMATGDPFEDIEYDSEDERFMQELKAKRTPLQETVRKARRAFGAFAACAIILAVCMWLMYGLPNWMAARSGDAWGHYTDPRIKTGLGKTINANWRDPHGNN